jgi:hypothetical protein
MVFRYSLIALIAQVSRCRSSGLTHISSRATCPHRSSENTLSDPIILMVVDSANRGTVHEPIQSGDISRRRSSHPLRPWWWFTGRLRRDKLSILTAPKLGFLKTTSAIMGSHFPQLRCVAAVSTDAERAVLEAMNIHAVIERGRPRGVDLATAVLEVAGRRFQSPISTGVWPSTLAR